MRNSAYSRFAHANSAKTAAISCWQSSVPNRCTDLTDVVANTTMAWTKTLSTVASTTFGALCITSALPFVGIPVPSRAWVTYYADKNIWLSKLSGELLTPTQAGYASAVLRLAVGAGCIYPPTREAALLLNGAVVCRGTMLAYRDGRPMRPQWTMLGAITLCLVLGRL